MPERTSRSVRGQTVAKPSVVPTAVGIKLAHPSLPFVLPIPPRSTISRTRPFELLTPLPPTPLSSSQRSHPTQPPIPIFIPPCIATAHHPQPPPALATPRRSRPHQHGRQPRSPWPCPPPRVQKSTRQWRTSARLSAATAVIAGPTRATARSNERGSVVMDRRCPHGPSLFFCSPCYRYPHRLPLLFVDLRIPFSRPVLHAHALIARLALPRAFILRPRVAAVRWSPTGRRPARRSRCAS